MFFHKIFIFLYLPYCLTHATITTLTTTSTTKSTKSPAITTATSLPSTTTTTKETPESLIEIDTGNLALIIQKMENLIIVLQKNVTDLAEQVGGVEEDVVTVKSNVQRNFDKIISLAKNVESQEVIINGNLAMNNKQITQIQSTMERLSENLDKVSDVVVEVNSTLEESVADIKTNMSESLADTQIIMTEAIEDVNKTLAESINDTKTSFNDLEHFNSDLTSDISDVSMRVINNSEQITKVQDMAYEYSEINQSNVKKITEVESSLEQTSQNLGEVSSTLTKVGHALNDNYSNPR